MKLIIVLLVLLALAAAQSPELRACIKEKCPEKYDKCLKTTGCEAKLEKCATKCGEKIAVTCWTLCIGVGGAAADVCYCAVNQKCLNDGSKLETLGLNLMRAIETYLDE